MTAQQSCSRYVEMSAVHCIYVCPWCRHEVTPSGCHAWDIPPSTDVILLAFTWCSNKFGQCVYQPGGMSTEAFLRELENRARDTLQSTERYRLASCGKYMGITTKVTYMDGNTGIGDSL